jgi:1-acyl-sn-glycerol-3-phosphate acyltransferase
VLYYRMTQLLGYIYFSLTGGIRVSGRENVPDRGAALLVSNHLSFWDVFALGIAFRRPLNFVARSSLFTPVLGRLITWMGSFPIQRDGIGVQGFKETLRRLKRGGIVTLFPEGTRSPDGQLQELKPGIAPLAVKAKVPVIPVGIAGTFEAWPRHRRFPRPHPVRLHIGPLIPTDELVGLSPEAATALIRDRIQQAIDVARLKLDQDLGRPAPGA